MQLPVQSKEFVTVFSKTSKILKLLFSLTRQCKNLKSIGACTERGSKNIHLVSTRLETKKKQSETKHSDEFEGIMRRHFTGEYPSRIQT
jgi:hypothetical protein